MIVCTQDGQPHGWQYGPLPGKVQSVPRAELHALTQLIAQTDGGLIVSTDSDYVYKGYHRGPFWILI